MNELYVYTTTSELARAWGENEQERTAFIRSVVEPWDREHPDARIAWVASPSGADQTAIGFLDTSLDVPEGLSRNQMRHHLIPARGKTGQPYRDILEQMAALPSRTAVFKRFGVPCRVIGGVSGMSARWCMTRAARLDGTLYVVNDGPLSSPHLVTAKLSEFYAAKERQTEVESLAAADSRAAAQ